MGYVYDIYELEGEEDTLFIVCVGNNILGFFDTLAEADECVKKDMDATNKIFLN
jgi:hypothetical protein